LTLNEELAPRIRRHHDHEAGIATCRIRLMSVGGRLD
jgi:hypothetical protein